MKGKGIICDGKSSSLLYPDATLLALLLWRIQTDKLKNAETVIKELKIRRVEGAKANEKVVGIFASHQQRWIMEKKKFTQQIRLLSKQVQIINTNISKLQSQLQAKDKLLEEEKGEHEETVKKVEEMHSKEIWKHKCAFIELVSTQRQLEAEMGRAVRQVEAEKQELDAVLGQKEEYVLMTQKFSMELIKTRRDLEQKDKILSAMLRKSKMDSQVKMSKKSKTEKSKTVAYALRSMLHKFIPQSVAGQQSELDRDSAFSQQPPIIQELADIRRGPLEGWVQCEAEKYLSAVEERHQLEVIAFAEQLRLKDEKLRWHSVEFKRLQSHIEGLITNLKEQNLLLLDRESELHALKEQMSPSIINQVSLEESSLKDTAQSPDKEYEDNKNTSLDIISVGGRQKDDDEYTSSTWKMDLHALGVFYKLKRLNQQLVMFERKQESCKRDDMTSLLCLVNKQINRYQSLQDKANDICKRMHENDDDKEETKKLEQFLEETFQLQRFIVATGQKLMEIQSKIASGFEMKKFADCLRTLFREVQRGLEVRISRIIGDLLAWDVMIHPRN